MSPRRRPAAIARCSIDAVRLSRLRWPRTWALSLGPLDSSPPVADIPLAAIDISTAFLDNVPGEGLMGELVNRVLLHLDSGKRRVVDPEEVYYLKVLEEATRVRLRAGRGA